MKTFHSFFLILSFLSLSLVAAPVSIEEFEKNTNEDERLKLIQQAPSGEREELQKINLHMVLLEQFGGEAELKAARETQVSRARGLGWLEDLFIAETGLCDQYLVAVVNKDRDKSGRIPADRGPEVITLMNKVEALRRDRQPSIHSLVFNLAPSPEAIELAKEAEELYDEWSKKYNLDGTHMDRPAITKEQLTEVDKQVDQIFAKMQKLPKLTPDQAQKELDGFTDDKVRSW
jgi:hypothetical protein